MDAQVDGRENVCGTQLNQFAPEFLSQLTTRELMDALMAADMPMGGTHEQRIERLLSAMQPQDLAQFFPQAVLQRMSSSVRISVG